MAEDRSIRRSDLPAVVKRAAELASIDDEAQQELPEDEVIRIAAELGLAERHVRQALFEGARDEPEPTWLDRQFGTPRILATRAVPLEPEGARRALEDYFVTCEYLQVVRRQGNSTTFEPASDPVSKVARAFRRGSRHELASAQGIEMSVRSLEQGWSHVRVRALYEDDRRQKVVGGSIAGGMVGLPLGALTTVVVNGLANGVLIPEVSIALGGVAGIAVFSSTIAGVLASTRNRWRRWRQRTQNQAEGVLDRLEKGDDLRPPPSPLMRRLQMKFGRL